MMESETLKRMKMCIGISPSKNIVSGFKLISDALEELQQYETIGTVEEFKTLNEKSIAKKPRFYAHNYYCTECNNLVGNDEFEWQRFLYCDKCGQKLDWSEEE